jgi:hypothetical protein
MQIGDHILIHSDANVAPMFRGRQATVAAIYDDRIKVAIQGCCGRHHVVSVRYGEFSFNRQIVTERPVDE